MFDLPTYSQETELGERGVRMVQEAVEQQLHWILRVKRKVDVGIDAEIEIINKNRKATGLLISAQIKCGKSYFRERNKRSFVFRGELTHLRYWLDHSLPVIVILCNPESGNCHWTEVTAGSMTILEAGWKMEVPRANRLDRDAKWQLERVAQRSQLLDDLINLAVYRWLNEKYSGRIQIASMFEMPRDYHWYSHLTRIDGTMVMVHHIYDRYGRFDPDELQEALSYKPYNERQCGATKLILCLVSSSRSAFRFQEPFARALPDDPDVEIVRLLQDGGSFIYEITEDDELVDGYDGCVPLTFGRKLLE
ncbi:DUF4365 domain-containing protein [Mycobacterium sp. KBS0706]|uniref:DUF4365 domain-containing protein n=1 Tax=Mycobacterium sp. KBS0706 TaxID=2578109 RepID=UPI00163DCF12|nr:DUF4365 domain-containing protein [Mycobacterium sp. KBS0706]